MKYGEIKAAMKKAGYPVSAGDDAMTSADRKNCVDFCYFQFGMSAVQANYAIAYPGILVSKLKMVADGAEVLATASAPAAEGTVIAADVAGETQGDVEGSVEESEDALTDSDVAEESTSENPPQAPESATSEQPSTEEQPAEEQTDDEGIEESEESTESTEEQSTEDTSEGA